VPDWVRYFHRFVLNMKLLLLRMAVEIKHEDHPSLGAADPGSA
jgi:hypothetical protein